MDVKSPHVQSVACPRMRILVLQTMDFQSIVVDFISGDRNRPLRSNQRSSNGTHCRADSWAILKFLIPSFELMASWVSSMPSIASLI